MKGATTILLVAVYPLAITVMLVLFARARQARAGYALLAAGMLLTFAGLIRSVFNDTLGSLLFVVAGCPLHVAGALSLSLNALHRMRVRRA